MGSVIAEVKVLQRLVKQLSSATPVKAEQAVGGDAHAFLPAPPAEAAQPAASSNVTLVASEGAVVAPKGYTPPAPVSKVPGTTPGQAPGMTGLDDDSILEIVRHGLEQNRVDLVLQPIVHLPQRKRVF